MSLLLSLTLLSACGSSTAARAPTATSQVTATRATSGSVTEFPLPQGGIPGAITTGPDGARWFGENGKIGRIEP
jgi:streptogramin lyase